MRHDAHPLLRGTFVTASVSSRAFPHPADERLTTVRSPHQAPGLSIDTC
jgi:hypothetical protein